MGFFVNFPPSYYSMNKKKAKNKRASHRPQWLKKLLIAFGIIILLGAWGIWLTLGPATSFDGNEKAVYLYPADCVPGKLEEKLKQEGVLTNPLMMKWLASPLNLWTKIRPGKYTIQRNQSLLQTLRMLRNNQQTEVRWAIKKVRTPEQFAGIVGKLFSTDSLTCLNFISSSDSLASYGVNSDQFMTLIFPDTYFFYWNTPIQRIIEKIAEQRNNFWATGDRMALAAKKGLTPEQVYTLASIVEEETYNDAEKGKVASVYLNRLRKGMPLGADPTIKFALRDFGLKRILHGHLQVASPYNTYRNKGLPPGPICTPGKASIDAVLNAPETNYLFFVANSDFSQNHIFTSNYQDHLKYAKQYQQALNNRYKNATP